MTSDDLESLAKSTERLRLNTLLGINEHGNLGDDNSLGPISEQLYLKALGALEEAQRNFSLAKIYRMRGD